MSMSLLNKVRNVAVTALITSLAVGALATGPAQAADLSSATSKAVAPAAAVTTAMAPAAKAVAPAAAVTTAMAPAAKAVAPAAGVANLAAPKGGHRVSGNWTYWGYRYSRAETAVIASISLWNAISGVKGTQLIPFSAAIVAIYAYTWVVTARNARAMGQCLGITYSGTGLWVRCTS